MRSSSYITFYYAILVFDFHAISLYGIITQKQSLAAVKTTHRKM